MKSNNKEIWIKEGYETFADQGQNSLKIERLAKKIGISKSSFYHHFADIEIFIDLLLKYHAEQAKIIAQKEHQAKNIDPDLINILLEHKIDLLFNRQLRINQNIKSYSIALEMTNKILGDAFVSLWVQDMKLNLSKKQIEGIFTVALENFFLQINEKTLNYNWLSNYFKSLKKIASAFV